MEFYIADNIKYVLQTKRRLIPFSPALILSNHTDNTFCCDFDIDLTLIFVYHSTLQPTFQRKTKQMETFIAGCILHVISVISAHPFPLCFFENPSLHIHVSCLCMSFSIYEVMSNVQTWMHTFLQIIIYKFPIATYSNYR